MIPDGDIFLPRLRGFAQRAALPSVTIASGALALSSAPLAARLRKRLPGPVADLLVNLGIFGAVGVMLSFTERVAPFRPEWNEPDDELGVDLGYLALVFPPTALASRSLANAISAHLPSGLGRKWWPNRQPLVVRVGLALLISEFVRYWHHRLSHEVELLWLMHAPHHSEKRLYWVTATRLHPADEVPLLVLQVAALAACGVDADALLTHNTLKTVHGLLQHANVDGSTGPLNLLFSTAEQHRVHHGQSAGGRASNYGAVLNLWDRVFGTVEQPDPDGFTGEVGLRDMPDYPTTLGGQLVEPLRSTRRLWRVWG